MKLTLSEFEMKDIEYVSRHAQQVADETNMAVYFTFNDVDCVAEPSGDWELLANRQQHAQHNRPVVNSLEGAMA